MICPTNYNQELLNAIKKILENNNSNGGRSYKEIDMKSIKEHIDDFNKIILSHNIVNSIEENLKSYIDNFTQYGKLDRISDKSMIFKDRKWTDQISDDEKKVIEETKNGILKFVKYIDDKLGTDLYNKTFNELYNYAGEKLLNGTADNSYDNKDKVKDLNTNIKFLLSHIKNKVSYFKYDYIKNNLLDVSIGLDSNTFFDKDTFKKLKENPQFKDTILPSILESQNILNYLKPALSIYFNETKGINFKSNEEFNKDKTLGRYKIASLFNNNIDQTETIKSIIQLRVNNPINTFIEKEFNGSPLAGVELNDNDYDEFETIVKSIKNHTKKENFKEDKDFKSDWIKAMNFIYKKYGLSDKENNILYENIPTPESIFNLIKDKNQKRDLEEFFDNYNYKTTMVYGDPTLHKNILFNIFDPRFKFFKKYLVNLLSAKDSISKFSTRFFNEGSVNNQQKYNYSNTTIRDILNQIKSKEYSFDNLRNNLGYYIPSEDNIILRRMKGISADNPLTTVSAFGKNLITEMNKSSRSLIDYLIYSSFDHDVVGSRYKFVPLGYTGDSQLLHILELPEIKDVNEKKSILKRILTEEIFNRVTSGRTGDENFLTFGGNLISKENLELQKYKDILTGNKYKNSDKSNFEEKDILLSDIKEDLTPIFDNVYNEIYKLIASSSSETEKMLLDYKSKNNTVTIPREKIDKHLVYDYVFNRIVAKHEYLSLMGTNIYKYKDLDDFFKRSQSLFTRYQNQNVSKNEKIKYAVFDPGNGKYDKETDGVVFMHPNLSSKILYNLGKQDSPDINSYNYNMALKLVGIGNGGQIKASFLDTKNYPHIQKYMEVNGIDMLVPKSAMKVNIEDSQKPNAIESDTINTLFENGIVNELAKKDKSNVIKEMPLYFLKHQQEEHVDMKTKGDMLSQVINNMNKIKLENIKFRNKDVKFKEFNEVMGKVTRKLLVDNFSNISDNKKFKALFNEEIKKYDPYTQNELKKVIDNPTIAMGMSDDVSKIMIPMLNKYIGIKMNRIKYAQEPGIFLNNKQDIDGITWIDNDFKEGNKERSYFIKNEDGTYEASVVVPFNFKNNYGDNLKLYRYINKDGILDMNKIDPDMLNILSFRVPNNGKNMQINLKIVGFTDENSSNIIYVPHGIADQMGSDFDIDALYNFFNEYEVDKTGKLNKYKSEGSLKDINNNMDKMKEKELKNHLLDMYRSILTDPKVYKDYINKNSEDELNVLKDTLADRLKDRNKINQVSGSPIVESMFKDKMQDADAGVGMSISAIGSINTIIDALRSDNIKNAFNFTTKYNTKYDIKIGEQVLKQMGEGITLEDKKLTNIQMMSAISNYFLDAMKMKYQLGEININKKTTNAFMSLLGMVDEKGNALPFDTIISLFDNKLLSGLLDINNEQSQSLTNTINGFISKHKGGLAQLSSSVNTKEIIQEQGNQPGSDENVNESTQNEMKEKDDNKPELNDLKNNQLEITDKSLKDLKDLEDIKNITAKEIDNYMPYLTLLKNLLEIGSDLGQIRDFEGIISNEYKIDSKVLFPKINKMDKMEFEDNRSGISNKVLTKIFSPNGYLGYVKDILNPTLKDKLINFSLYPIYNYINDFISKNGNLFKMGNEKLYLNDIYRIIKLYPSALKGMIGYNEKLFPDLTKGDDTISNSKMYRDILFKQYLLGDNTEMKDSDFSRKPLDSEERYDKDEKGNTDFSKRYRNEGEYDDNGKYILTKYSKTNGEWVKDNNGKYYRELKEIKNPFSISNKYIELSKSLNKDEIPALKYLWYDYSKKESSLRLRGINYESSVEQLTEIKNSIRSIINGDIELPNNAFRNSNLSDEEKESLKNDLKIFFKTLLMSDSIKSETQFTSNISRIFPESLYSEYGVFDGIQKLHSELELDESYRDKFLFNLINKYQKSKNNKDSAITWDQDAIDNTRFTKQTTGFNYSSAMENNIDNIATSLSTDSSIGSHMHNFYNIFLNNELFTSTLDKQNIKDSKIKIDDTLKNANGKFLYNNDGKIEISMNFKGIKSNNHFSSVLAHELLHASLDRIMKLKDNVNLKEEYEKLKKSNPVFIATLDKYEDLRKEINKKITDELDEINKETTAYKDAENAKQNAKEKIESEKVKNIKKDIEFINNQINEVNGNTKEYVDDNSINEKLKKTRLDTLNEKKGELENKLKEQKKMDEGEEKRNNRKYLTDEQRKVNERISLLGKLYEKTSSLSEMTAEFLTPKSQGGTNKLREYLNDIKSDNEKGTWLNRAWDRLKRLFMDMLNIKKGSKSEDTLDFIMDLKNKFNVMENDSNFFDNYSIITNLKNDPSYSLIDRTNEALGITSNHLNIEQEPEPIQKDAEGILEHIRDLENESAIKNIGDEIRSKIAIENKYTAPKEFSDTLNSIISSVQKQYSKAITERDVLSKIAISNMLKKLGNHLLLASANRVEMFKDIKEGAKYIQKNFKSLLSSIDINLNNNSSYSYIQAVHVLINEMKPLLNFSKVYDIDDIGKIPQEELELKGIDYIIADKNTRNLFSSIEAKITQISRDLLDTELSNSFNKSLTDNEKASLINNFWNEVKNNKVGNTIANFGSLANISNPIAQFANSILEQLRTSGDIRIARNKKFIRENIMPSIDRLSDELKSQLFSRDKFGRKTLTSIVNKDYDDNVKELFQVISNKINKTETNDKDANYSKELFKKLKDNKIEIINVNDLFDKSEEEVNGKKYITYELNKEKEEAFKKSLFDLYNGDQYEINKRVDTIKDSISNRQLLIDKHIEAYRHFGSSPDELEVLGQFFDLMNLDNIHDDYNNNKEKFSSNINSVSDLRNLQDILPMLPSQSYMRDDINPELFKTDAYNKFKEFMDNEDGYIPEIYKDGYLDVANQISEPDSFITRQMKQLFTRNTIASRKGIPLHDSVESIELRQLRKEYNELDKINTSDAAEANNIELRKQEILQKSNEIHNLHDEDDLSKILNSYTENYESYKTKQQIESKLSLINNIIKYNIGDNNLSKALEKQISHQLYGETDKPIGLTSTKEKYAYNNADNNAIMAEIKSITDEYNELKLKQTSEGLNHEETERLIQSQKRLNELDTKKFYMSGDQLIMSLLNYKSKVTFFGNFISPLKNHIAGNYTDISNMVALNKTDKYKGILSHYNESKLDITRNLSKFNTFGKNDYEVQRMLNIIKVSNILGHSRVDVKNPEHEQVISSFLSKGLLTDAYHLFTQSDLGRRYAIFQSFARHEKVTNGEGNEVSFFNGLGEDGFYDLERNGFNGKNYEDMTESEKSDARDNLDKIQSNIASRTREYIVQNDIDNVVAGNNKIMNVILSQFKRWVTPFLMQRFGDRKQSFITGDISEGYFKTFRDLYSKYGIDDNPIMSLLKATKDIHNALFNVQSLKNKGLDDYQVKNLAKLGIDLTFAAISAIGIYAIAGGIKKMDKDKRSRFMIALNLLYSTAQENSQIYSPVSFSNSLITQVSAIKQAKDIQEFLFNSIETIFDHDPKQVKKLWNSFEKNTPLLSVYRTLEMEKKLFLGNLN